MDPISYYVCLTIITQESLISFQDLINTVPIEFPIKPLMKSTTERLGTLEIYCIHYFFGHMFCVGSSIYKLYCLVEKKIFGSPVDH